MHPWTAAAAAAGGLIINRNNTGTPNNTRSPMESLASDFDEAWDRSLNNTGGRGSSKGGSNRPPKRIRACLADCDGVAGVDPVFSATVAHLAGSAAVYSSANPADVRARVNLVSAVRNQGDCATCISHVIASAAESAAAAAQRINARLLNISHSYLYFCAPVFVAGSRLTCGTGWRFDLALTGVSTAPFLLSMNSSCITRDLSIITQPSVMTGLCQGARAKCSDTSFTCQHITLSDGLAQIQRHIRKYGSVMTSLRVTQRFKNFFEVNKTGVFNETAAGPLDSAEPAFNHAVLLIGELGAVRVQSADAAAAAAAECINRTPEAAAAASGHSSQHKNGSVKKCYKVLQQPELMHAPQADTGTSVAQCG